MRKLATALILCLAAPTASAQDETKIERVLVVCDFESGFDGGTLGKFAANNFRAKIARYRLFFITEDMDREPIEKQAGFKPRFDMPPKVALDYAKEWLDAEMLMWGKVEQAGGEQLRIYARVADARVGTDKYRLDTSALVASKYAIQVGVLKILKELTGLTLTKYPPLPPDAEERWKKGPNLVRSNGFERGTGHPEGWEPFGVDWQMGQAHWEQNPDGPGKCIVYRMSKGVAAMEGVAYYTQFFGITPGATYRVQVRAKSMAPTCKVFVKYYAWLHTPSEPKGQWREVGRSPMNLKGPKRQWGVYERDCHPRIYRTRTKRVYRVEKCRIGLYAYWPAGVVYWDDVVFKKIADAPKEVKPYDVGATGRKPIERSE